MQSATEVIIKKERFSNQRSLLFLLFSILAFIIFKNPLLKLFHISFNNELYSHILFIPVISGYLIFSARSKIFSEKNYSFVPGTVLIICGILLYLLQKTHWLELNVNDILSLTIFALFLFWVGGFVLFYGTGAARKAAFPLLFLLFFVPIPLFLLDRLIYLLQSASTEVSYLIFKITGVPVFREGFIFHLPGLNVEVAKECSGIRSSIALLITSTLAGHLFLRTGWKKLLLVLLMFPLTVLKNGIRIVTLSLLGAYVDISFLTNSRLHNDGGILFFILALIFFSPVFWLLMKTDKQKEGK